MTDADCIGNDFGLTCFSGDCVCGISMHTCSPCEPCVPNSLVGDTCKLNGCPIDGETFALDPFENPLSPCLGTNYECKCGTSTSCSGLTTGSHCDADNNICKCSADVESCSGSTPVCKNGVCVAGISKIKISNLYREIPYVTLGLMFSFDFNIII